MSASSLMSIKLDSEEKLLFAQNAEAIGLTPSAAVKVFVRRFNECGGFPFDVRRAPRLNPDFDVPVAKMANGGPVMPESWAEEDDDDDEFL